jgi:hypothetical protein
LFIEWLPDGVPSPEKSGVAMLRRRRGISDATPFATARSQGTQQTKEGQPQC